MATEFPAGGLSIRIRSWLTEKATDYLRGDIPEQRRPTKPRC